jgi:GxxExxY protein
MKENEISYQIRGAIFEVHNQLGPGLLEKIYVQALLMELESRGLKTEYQVPVPVSYKGVSLREAFYLDILVNGKVIIEVKSVEQFSRFHFKQLTNYLKLTKLKLGILVNFNTIDIKDSIVRQVNGLENGF